MRFFRVCLTAMAILLICGFVVQLALGRSSFNAPLIVHVHGIAYMGWVAVTLAQAWLTTSGAVGAHRMLGRLSCVYALALLVLGPAVTLAAVQTGRAAFFFQPQHFLIANPATLLVFAGLFIAAVTLHARTDWHARLHISAFVALMGPGIGRLIPMPLMTPYAFEWASLLALVVPAIGIARDVKTSGRAHPAWLWGVSALILALALSRAVAFSPVGDAVYAAATAETVMAGSDGRAFPPPPGAQSGP
jgi:hypothetical protein